MNNDLISREALKEEVKTLFCPDGYKIMMLQRINNAPTVEPTFGLFKEMLCAECEKRPQGEWISVSERLPEEKINPNTNDLEKVLCSTIWGDVRPYKYGKPIGYDKAHFLLGGRIMDEYVIAWQPLPEPYKKGGAE